MINTNLLKSEIVKNGLTMENVAVNLNLTPRTFYYKMKTGKFWLSEAEQMIELLKIENPTEVFFLPKNSLDK